MNDETNNNMLPTNPLSQPLNYNKLRKIIQDYSLEVNILFCAKCQVSNWEHDLIDHPFFTNNLEYLEYEDAKRNQQDL